MHQYDSTPKLRLPGSAQRSLRELTGAAITRWLHIDLPEVGDRRAGLPGETAEGALIHIELQGQNDAAMPLRMAGYCLRIYPIAPPAEGPAGRHPQGIGAWKTT